MKLFFHSLLVSPNTQPHQYRFLILSWIFSLFVRIDSIVSLVHSCWLWLYGLSTHSQSQMYDTHSRHCTHTNCVCVYICLCMYVYNVLYMRACMYAYRVIRIVYILEHFYYVRHIANATRNFILSNEIHTRCKRIDWLVGRTVGRSLIYFQSIGFFFVR